MAAPSVRECSLGLCSYNLRGFNNSKLYTQLCDSNDIIFYTVTLANWPWRD